MKIRKLFFLLAAFTTLVFSCNENSNKDFDLLTQNEVQSNPEEKNELLIEFYLEFTGVVGKLIKEDLASELNLITDFETEDELNSYLLILEADLKKLNIYDEIKYLAEKHSFIVKSFPEVARYNKEDWEEVGISALENIQKGPDLGHIGTIFSINCTDPLSAFKDSDLFPQYVGWTDLEIAAEICVGGAQCYEDFENTLEPIIADFNADVRSCQIKGATIGLSTFGITTSATVGFGAILGAISGTVTATLTILACVDPLADSLEIKCDTANEAFEGCCN